LALAKKGAFRLTPPRNKHDEALLRLTPERLQHTLEGKYLRLAVIGTNDERIHQVTLLFFVTLVDVENMLFEGVHADGHTRFKPATKEYIS
jgi:hypothetical protein